MCVCWGGGAGGGDVSQTILENCVKDYKYMYL